MIRLRDPWRTRVLWLSLAGNLFAAPFLGAHFMMQRPSGPPGLDGVVERMARSLPDEDAVRFRATLEHERPWYDLARRQMDEAREQLSRAIAQQPSDAAGVRGRSTSLRAPRASRGGRSARATC